MRTETLAAQYRRYNAAKKGARAKDAAPAAPAPKVKSIGGAKNGGKRTVLPKSAKYYPADDEKKPKYVRTKAKAFVSTRIATLRPSITPGTVLILLSGRFRGKRVVFLKQLEKSGLLLVSGVRRCRLAPRMRCSTRHRRVMGAALARCCHSGDLCIATCSASRALTACPAFLMLCALRLLALCLSAQARLR